MYSSITHSRCRDRIPSRTDALTVVNLVPDKSLNSKKPKLGVVYITTRRK